MEDREYVIHVRRPWALWILPILALLYFAFVVFLAATGQHVRGVPDEYLVWGGLALFVLVLIVEVPLLMRRRERAPAAEASEEPDWTPPETTDEAPAFAPPPAAAPAEAIDDELVTTSETQKGLQVLEYSRPAKSVNKGSVYAKAYVPVTKEFVLRVETLAADRTEV